jgi:hypothetical protein
MRPFQFLATACLATGVVGEILNGELNEFLAQFARPETMKPLTRCQVRKLQSLFMEEVTNDPRFTAFQTRNESLPVTIEYSPSEEDSSGSVDEIKDFDVIVSDIDAQIEAMLDDFYGPADEEACSLK